MPPSWHRLQNRKPFSCDPATTIVADKFAHIDEIEMENPSYTTAESPSLLRKGTRLVVSVILIGLVLMFSALLFVTILTVGTMIWGYLWWRTRNLRKQMRNHSPVNVEGEMVRGEVIEGEAVRVVDANYRSGH